MKNFKKLKKNKKSRDFSAIAKKLAPVGYIACGILIGVLVMLMVWPDRIATLKNGEQKIISVGNFEISADELYNELKQGDPISAALNIIDGRLLHEMYPDLEEEAKKASNTRAQEIYENFESYYGYTKEQFLEAQGFANENKFLEYLVEEYYYQKYFDEYTKSLLDDSDINDYYKDNVIGDKEIVIFSGKKEDLEKVRTALKKGKSITDIKSTYKDVTADDTTVTYQDKLSYTDAIWKKIKSTKEKSYSDVFDDSQSGSLVVYVKSSKDKADLKDIKDEVEKLVVAEKQDSDSSLRYKAFEKLREDNKLKFYDTELEKLYKEYVKSYK